MASAMHLLLLLLGFETYGGIAESSGGRVSEPALNFNVHLFMPPDQGNASLPVIFFVGGVAGNAPISYYSVLLTVLAEKGFVVVGLDRLSFPNYPKEAWDFLAVLRWAQEGNLKALMGKQGSEAVPDLLGRTAVMGQSAGNHVVGQALAYDCSIAKAWVLLDPVDGVDPYRIISSEDLITPGKKLNFTVPALILDTGLDPRPAGKLAPACAPLDLSTPRFFAAMRGPVWNVNATAYGHIDCLNDQKISDWICPTNAFTDKAAYRGHIAETTALFLRALFQGEQQSLALLADPLHFSIDVTTKQDLQGLAVGSVAPGCRAAPAEAPGLIV